MALRIFVADDHEVVRRGLCALLTSHSGWEICGEAGDGRQAVEKVARLKPGIVILDIGMPSLNGLDAARQIMHNEPHQKIAILSVMESEQVIHEALKAGARAYISKSDGARDLIVAIEALQQNETYFNSRLGEIVLNGFRNAGRKPAQRASLLRDLTAREREIAQLVAEGKSTKEVAVTLGVSVKTAETHRSNLMRKLGLHCVSELVLYAVRNNIVEVPGEQISGPGGRTSAILAA